MPNNEALHVHEPRGPRWELAVSLIGSGEGPVLLGNVQLWRSTSGPQADGCIQVNVEVSERASEAVAREALRLAHQTVEAAAASDEAFANLLLKHRSRWELVHNYGMGTTLVASEDQTGTSCGRRKGRAPNALSCRVGGGYARPDLPR